MPLGDAICGEPILGAVVAEIVEPTLLHTGRFGVGVNVAQGIERSCRFAVLVGMREAAAAIALFPKVAAAVEHSVKAHNGIPV